MFKRNFSVAALLVVLGAFLVAFSNERSENKAVFEYVSVTQTGYGILISQQGKPVEQLKIKVSDSDNYNPSFEVINKYETDGWELFASNTFNVGSGINVRNSYLLRRRK